MKHYLLVCLFLVLNFQGWAQQMGPKPWKRDTIIGDNVFKKYNNWVDVQFGEVIQNSNEPHITQIVAGVDYHFHIQKEYWQVGLLATGPAFDQYHYFQYANYDNYQFHFCYEKRLETKAYNFSYAGGLSYSMYGIWNDFTSQYDQREAVKLYLDVRYVQKLTFDVGVGLCAFADFNFNQLLTGVKADFFFSGSYKGKKSEFE